MATFDYTSRDFLSIRRDLLDRAAITIPEWDATDASDFGNVLVDLWAYMGDIIHFYVDRAASEAFLQTATQRESIMSIANLLDYIPASSRASRGTVAFQLNAFPPSSPSSYVIPQYTVLTGYDDDRNSYSFYTLAESTALTTVGNQVVVTAVQGTLVSNETVALSNGTANQRYTLVKKGVDIDSIVVSVAEGPLDGGGNPTDVTYQYVSQLSTASYLDKVFTARLMSDGSTQIQFGNGFNGHIPTNNASITADYRTTAGAAGNLPANKIVTVVGVPSSYVSVVSSSATYGGSDAESLESIRTNVSRLYRTQDRAVSLQDYKDLSLQVPGISKATVVPVTADSKVISTTQVSGANLNVTTSTAISLVVGQLVTISSSSNSAHNITNAHVAAITSSTQFSILVSEYATAPTGSGTGGLVTTKSQAILYPVPHQSSYPPAPDSGSVAISIPTPIEESIEAYFVDRSMMGVTAHVIQQPTTINSTTKYIKCVPIYVRFKVYVLDNYVQSWVTSQIDQAVRNLLTFDKVKFGQVVTVGDVYRAALSVAGVDYVEILNLNTTYWPLNTVGVVANVAISDTELPCFTDELLSNPAISFAPSVGGLTGSN